MVQHLGPERMSGQSMQAMFQRVLANWAVDALALRRRGLDRPCCRDGAGFAPRTPGRAEPGPRALLANPRGGRER